MDGATVWLKFDNPF